MTVPQRPLPAPDALTRTFWESASRQELAVQRCEACRTYQHPPAARCHHCGSLEAGFTRVSGRARLHSWTVVRQPLAPGFANAVPYLNLLVELDEQAGLLMLCDTVSRPIHEDSLRVGERMRVWFEEIAPSVMLPQFAPEGDAK